MLFNLTDEDYKKAQIWWEAHCKEKHKGLIRKWDDGSEYIYTGAIGGGLSYRFSPTSIGTFTWAKCGLYINSPDECIAEVCGEELNLTDYDSL